MLFSGDFTQNKEKDFCFGKKTLLQRECLLPAGAGGLQDKGVNPAELGLNSVNLLAKRSTDRQSIFVYRGMVGTMYNQKNIPRGLCTFPGGFNI